MNKFLTPFKIKEVEFKNRILRSSIGGRTANWDGEVTEVWKNFEKRFADGGVGGIISTTLNVDENRLSPLQYPALASNKYIPRLKKYITEIKQSGCPYIIQIGDPGYATQTSLFPEDIDSVSSSSGFDMVYGYNNTRSRLRKAMSGDDPIERLIQKFVDAARRAQDTGADGLEITAAKGYLIHQFLNPNINQREDKWGGSAEKRFELLREIVGRVRQGIGHDDKFIFGLRLAAEDVNTSPRLFWLCRIPWNRQGNRIQQNIEYVKKIAKEIDFLHVVSGFGFPSPQITPGRFPTEEINIFFNHTSHLSTKAWFRSAMLNMATRTWLIRQISEFVLQKGWKYHEGINLKYARQFKQNKELNDLNKNLVIINNGGFQEHKRIEQAINDNACDMISMARPLIANPNLINEYWKKDSDPTAEEKCSYCNKCVGRTATSPLGCYDINRFPGDTEREKLLAMQKQLNEWNIQDKLAAE